MANKGGKNGNTEQLYFLGLHIPVDGDGSHGIEGHLLLGVKGFMDLDSILEIRHHFADKGLSSQSRGFSSSHVRM